MNYKKIIVIVSLVLVMAAAVIAAGYDMESDTERIELIEDYLHSTYQGKFVLVSDEPIISRDNSTAYGYTFVTVDERKIEFSVYYKRGKLFNKSDYTMSSNLDYAVAEYVIAKSEFANDEYDITYVDTREVTEHLYALAIEERRILEEYGQTWFVPQLNVKLVYRDETFEFSFNYASSIETIYIGLNRNIAEIDEHY